MKPPARQARNSRSKSTTAAATKQYAAVIWSKPAPKSPGRSLVERWRRIAISKLPPVRNISHAVSTESTMVPAM